MNEVRIITPHMPGMVSSRGTWRKVRLSDGPAVVVSCPICGFHNVITADVGPGGRVEQAVRCASHACPEPVQSYVLAGWEDPG